MAATGETTNDGAAYDPLAEIWRPLPPASLEPRYGAASAVLDGQLVVWGGTGAEGGSTLTDGAVYDPDRDRWSSLPDLPGGLDVDAEGIAPQLETVEGRLVLNQTLRDDHGAQHLAVLDRDDDAWELLPWPAGLRRQPYPTAGPASTFLLWGGILPNDLDLPPLDGVLLDLTTGTSEALLGRGGQRSEPAFTAQRSPVRNETAVWTGREFLIWGNLDAPWSHSSVGLALDPQALTAER